MSTQAIAPVEGGIELAQRKGHMAALAAAEHIMSIAPFVPENITTACRPWAASTPSLDIYFHHSAAAVEAFASALDVPVKREPRSGDHPKVHVSVEGEVLDIPVLIWTLVDAPEVTS